MPNTKGTMEIFTDALAKAPTEVIVDVEAFEIENGAMTVEHGDNEVQVWPLSSFTFAKARNLPEED